MKYAWDMMFTVSRIEQHCFNLRKLTCDGSMLNGHTLNEKKAAANKGAVHDVLAAMKVLVETAQELADA